MNFQKNLRVKCETYWPEIKRQTTVYGDVKVTLVSINHHTDFVVRKFYLESVRDKLIKAKLFLVLNKIRLFAGNHKSKCKTISIFDMA